METQVGEVYKESPAFDSRNPWKVKFPRAKDGLHYVFGYPSKSMAELGAKLALSIQKSIDEKIA